MRDKGTDSFIINTTKDDVSAIFWLFEQAISLKGKAGYKAWDSIDQAALISDIENGLQFKIIEGSNILCIFSIQLSDPFIWRDRDKNDAIYLHRIVVNPNFKGQKQFEKVLNWAKEYAMHNALRYVRMDTWADNQRIIDYYMSFGFKFIENYKTTNIPELPLQNRNLNVALLQLVANEYE